MTEEWKSQGVIESMKSSLQYCVDKGSLFSHYSDFT